MLKISNSELRKFKRCRRSWWLTYYRRLTPIYDGVGPLSIGNMLHHTLEGYYATTNRDPETYDWGSRLDEYAQVRLDDERLPEHLHPQMQTDLELCRIMLSGYFVWLQDDGADSDVDVLSAEQEVETFLGEILGEDVSLIGKLDIRARLKSTGQRVMIDHKSVQNLADLPKTGELDEQLRTYGLLERMAAVAAVGEVCGLDVGWNNTACGLTKGHKGHHKEAQRLLTNGGVWNMLRKVKRTAAAKPPFYGRAGVQHNDEVYRNMFARIWGEVTDIMRVRAELDNGGNHQAIVYPNPTRDCSWDCNFFTLCARFDDNSDVENVLSQEFEVNDPYERYVEIEKG